MSSLAEKLHPSRFTAMSGFMAALVGFILNKQFTELQIEEVLVSEEEGLVYIRHKDDVCCNTFKSLADFRINWNKLLDAAELTPEERKQVVRLFNERVKIVPGTKI